MMMTHTMHTVTILVLALAYLSPAGWAQETPLSAEEQIIELTNRKTYTAQRKPRVTVMRFDDTNSAAQRESFGASVSAMLTTFFKDKSQFIIVERQNIQRVLDEWKNNQGGLTNLETVDPGAREILEKIDVIVLGNVTMLGNDIEIDAKLLSRSDARIIAATQRGGPKECLRKIVERLGIALEQTYLRPYYGTISITVDEPENTSVFVTPVLLADALDEEKPPVELGTTITPEGNKDRVEHWITNPTTYTIKNILSGWYTLRLERPGYEPLSTDNSRWTGIATAEGIEVYYKDVNALGKIGFVPLQRVDPEVRKYLVQVKPLQKNKVSASFSMEKKGGALDTLVKRPFVDTEFATLEGARTTLRSLDLDINGRMAQTAVEAETCDFFEYGELPYPDLGSVVVRAGSEFHFEDFKGGDLVIEDYHGETLPVGRYQVSTWVPFHELKESEALVAHSEQAKVVRQPMARRFQELIILGKGEGKIFFEGGLTGHKEEQVLDSEDGRQVVSLPVDKYRVTTSIPGFKSWHRSVDLMPQKEEPPVLEKDAESLSETAPTVELRIKSSLWVAGRTEGFPEESSLFYETRVAELLDQILGGAGTGAGSGSALDELESRLEDVDLLILSEKDMNNLRVVPRAAASIRQFVENGHALLAFVTSVGDYRTVLGASLRVDEQDNEDELKIFPGRVNGFGLSYEIDLGEDRPLPKLEHDDHRIASWRVLSYTKKKKHPRIVERGKLETGGYALVWAESSSTAAGFRPGQASWGDILNSLSGAPQRPKSEDEKKQEAHEAQEKTRKANAKILRIRSQLMRRALVWARYLMYRRLDGDQSQVMTARQELEMIGLAERAGK